MFASQIFVFSCVAFVVGIFIGLVLPNFQLILLGFLFFISFLLGLKFKKLKWAIFFGLIFFVLGLLRADFSRQDILTNKLQDFNDKEIMVVQGRIVQEPEITLKNQKLVLKTEKINEEKFLGQGNIVIYTQIRPQYNFGQEIRITGKLTTPPVLDDFDYQKYFAQKGIYSIALNPQIEPLPDIKERGINLIYQTILNFKAKLRSSVNQIFSSPNNLLLNSFILGDKNVLPETIKQSLNRAGLRHLIAVSGLNLTIFINALMFLLLGLGLWRKQAFWLTIIFIAFFVLLTGCQPSAIRASIMGFLFLLGQQLGRTNDSSRIIWLGAALMLTFDPFFLVEAGFQLSFLAVMGINYFLPIFSRLFRKIPNVCQARNILAMTLSAQIFTLPILIYNFGSVSLIAPLANILVLPISSFIIVFGFLAAIFGIFSYYLALIFAFPCWLMLFYLLKITDFCSSFTFSAISIHLSWLWLIIFYLVLIYFVWQWKKEHRFKILGF